MSKKPTAFVTREIPQAALQLIGSAAEIEVWPHELPPSHSDLMRRAPNIDSILCLLTDQIDEEFIAAATQLKVVSQMAVGVDNISLPACRERRIPVGHTPGVLADTTADLTFGLILTAARRLVEADRYVRSGEWLTWGPMMLAGADVHHATIGIVGMGAIGRKVAKRAHGFDMRILYAARSRCTEVEDQYGARLVELATLLHESDFVTLHVPLTAQTRGLIGANQLTAMRRSAFLVNTSRGPVVDEAALVAALMNGTLAGAGLDVYECEPLPRTSRLLGLDNVILLPHIGSASVATRTRMALMAAANLVAGLQGRPLPNPVANQGMLRTT